MALLAGPLNRRTCVESDGYVTVTYSRYLTLEMSPTTIITGPKKIILSFSEPPLFLS
jgi:hypothetical protein